jgi:hypothetical protein
MSGPLVLLGPQRGCPRLSKALEHHGCTGELAVITAGWRYDEAELDTLQRDLGMRLTPLPLYAWFEELCAKDPALARAYSQRQQQIIAYKSAYRDQLKHTMAAVAAMQRRVEHDEPLYGPELQFTHEALRALDARAVHRVNSIRASAPPTSKPWDLPLVRAHHDQIAEVLDRVDAVLIAGGHVGVLRNRLFFFGLDVLLPRALANGTAVFAWSAGAMALAEHIFLFYDDPPEGEGHAEVLDSGLNLVPGLRIFPHAQRRLRTDDAERMTRLVDRLRPSRLLTLEAGAWLEHTDAHGWMDRSEPGSASIWEPTGRAAPPASAFPLAAPRLDPGVRTVVP